MPENQNNIELANEDLKEINIEEVERLLSLIGDGKDVFDNSDFASLDGNDDLMATYEREIMEKLEDISNKKEFLEELLSEIKKLESQENETGLFNNIGEKLTSGAVGILEFYNDSRNKENLIEDFNQNKNKIQNSYLRKYIDLEMKRLEGGEEVNDWTFLLMTYIENQSKGMTYQIEDGETESQFSSIKRNIHNSTQENYIKNILGNNEGFNENYLKGYNNEISNYLIKIEDFEEVLKDGSITVLSENSGEDNPNQINSRALGNYFLYLNERGQLNKENLLNKISINKLRELKESWSGENQGESNNIAKDILTKNGVLEEIDGILKMTHEIQGMGNAIEENNDYINNQMEVEYISKNPDLIYSLTSEEKLNKVLNLLPDGETIDLTDINPAILKSYILHDKVKISNYGIQEIPKEIMDNNLGILIYKFKNSGNEQNINYLLLRAANIGVDKNIIKEKIEEYDLIIPSNFGYINFYINESVQRGLEFAELSEKYNNFEDFESTKDISDNLSKHEEILLTEYLLQTIDNENSIDILVKLIGLNYNGANGELINIPTNNTDVAKALINRGSVFFKTLTIEARGNKEVVGKLLEKLKEDSNGDKTKIIENIEKYGNYIDTTDINTSLKVMKFIDENSPWGALEKMPYEIRLRFMSEKIKNKMANSLGKGLDSNIDADNTEIFLKLLKLASYSKHVFSYQSKNREMNQSRETYNNKEELIDTEQKENRRESFVNGIMEKLENKNLLENSDEKARNEIIKELENFKNIDEVGKIGKDQMDKIYLIITSDLFAGIENEAEKEQKIIEFITLINKEFLSYNNEVIQEELNDLSLSGLRPGGLDKLVIQEIILENGETKEVIESESLTNYYREFLVENKDYDGDPKELFIEQNFKGLSEKQKQNIINIISLVDDQSEAIDKKNNMDTYVAYLRSGGNGNFRDYLVEEIGEEEYYKQLKIPFELNDNENSINYTNSINNYSNETGKLNFINSKGFNTTIELSQDEKNIVESSPEALDNIIDFYNLLNEVGLSKLWDVKDTIFNSISNVEGIGFNIDGDYLNENEVKIFINKILKSLGIDEIPSILDINNFKGKIMNINNTQFGDSQATNFLYGETYLENMFIEKFLPRGSVFGLLTTNFEENI